MRQHEPALDVPSSWEGRVESARATRVVGSPSALSLSAALAAVSGNTVVARRVQDGDTLHTELHIPKLHIYQSQIHMSSAEMSLLIALSSLICRRQVCFVVTV